MNKMILIAVAATLAGCSNNGDPNICKFIIDYTAPTNMSEAEKNRTDIGWQGNRASACIHRMAYRLAASNDPAETVTQAVLSACREQINTSTLATAEHMAKVFSRTDEASFERTVQQFENKFREEALVRVVEGRAGKCKEYPKET